MRISTVKLAGLGATFPLLPISILGLAGFEVPFGFWIVATLVLLTVTAIEVREAWRPGSRK